MCDKLDKIRDLGEKVSEQLDLVQNLMAALDTSNEGIALLDKEGRYVYLNKAHEEMFKYDEGEMVGQSWEMLYSPEQVEKFREEVFPTVAKEGKWNGLEIGTCKDGSKIREKVYLTALPDGGLICTCINYD